MDGDCRCAVIERAATPRGGRDAIEGARAPGRRPAVFKARVRAAPLGWRSQYCALPAHRRRGQCRASRCDDRRRGDVAREARSRQRPGCRYHCGVATIGDRHIAEPAGVTRDAICRYRLLISAIPAEGDLVEHARAEFLRRAGDGLAAERAVELDGGVVFRQRPHDRDLSPLCARSRRAAVNSRRPKPRPWNSGRR